MIYSLLTLVLAAGGLPAEASSETITNRIDRAARAYRIEVYDAHHDDRDLYNTHSQAGDRLLAAWDQAGQPVDFGVRVLKWFAAADAATLPAPAEFLAELEKIAGERPPILEDPTPIAVDDAAIDHPPAPITIETGAGPIQVDEPVKSEPSAADQAAEQASSFLGGLGRSLLRATISVGDGNPTARFD